MRSQAGGPNGPFAWIPDPLGSDFAFVDACHPDPPIHGTSYQRPFGVPNRKSIARPVRYYSVITLFLEVLQGVQAICLLLAQCQQKGDGAARLSTVRHAPRSLQNKTQDTF